MNTNNNKNNKILHSDTSTNENMSTNIVDFTNQHMSLNKYIEHVKDIITHQWKKEEKSHGFFPFPEELFEKKEKGRIIMNCLQLPLTEESIVLIASIMSNILSMRDNIYKDNLFNGLKDAASCENNIYTENTQFLSCMNHIQHIKDDIEFNDYMSENRILFEGNPELERDIVSVFASKKHVLHMVFRSKMFLDDLNDFVSTRPNSELSAECVWNVSMFVCKTLHRYVDLL
jgi:hypothetical protein